MSYHACHRTCETVCPGRIFVSPTPSTRALAREVQGVDFPTVQPPSGPAFHPAGAPSRALQRTCNLTRPIRRAAPRASQRSSRVPQCAVDTTRPRRCPAPIIFPARETQHAQHATRPQGSKASGSLARERSLRSCSCSSPLLQQSESRRVCSHSPSPTCDCIVRTPLSTHRGSRPWPRAITSGSSLIFYFFLISMVYACCPVAHTSRTPPHPAFAFAPRAHTTTATAI